MEQFNQDVVSLVVNTIFPEESEKSKRTKFEILQSFMASVSVHGFENTSYETIAKTMGTSKARVHYHFDDLAKINIYAIQFVYIIGQKYTQNRMDRVQGWENKVLGFALGAIDWFENHPTHMNLLLLSYYQASRSSDYKDLYDATRSIGKRRFFAIVEDQIQASEKEKQACIRFIQRAVFGALIELSCSNRKGILAEIKKELEADMLVAIGRLVSKQF